MSTLTLCSFNMSSLDEELPMEKRRKIVVAMDGSDHSKYALNWYKEHMHKPNDYVYLVHSVEWHHVIHNSKWHFSPQHNDIDTVGPLIKEEHTIIHSRLEKFKEELKKMELEGEVKPVHAKNPGEGVVQEAVALDATVIVTGTRGYGTIRRTILGSVSDYILHHSPVPVVVCHKHHEKHHKDKH